MDKIQIRALKDKDLEAVAKVIKKASYLSLKKQNLLEEDIKEIFKRHSPKELLLKVKGNLFFVAEDDNQIIGVIGLRKHNNSKIPNRISTFYIKPEYQGKKIGKALYEHVLNLAINLKIKTLFVKSSLQAEPIYAHYGFKRIREETKHYPNGTQNTTVWMEKYLI